MSPLARLTGVVLFAVLAIGAIANRAALRGPLVLDDFAQRAMIEGTLTPARGPFNLYDFVADDNRAALLSRGAIPWWSDPHLALRFLRPIPSVLVWVDHRFFGYGAFVPHFLSLLWWAAAALAAYVLYKTAVGDRAALVASAIFALSPTLTIPIVWVANRDALLTLTFGAGALAFYARWRRHRRRAVALAATAAFTASALTGEYSICLVGYIVAFEFGQRKEPFRRRLTGLLPAALPLVLYAGVHVALGYGTNGTGFYRDPIAQPLAYLRALPQVIPTLMALAWMGMDQNATWHVSRPWMALLLAAAAAVLIGTLWKMRRAPAREGTGGGAWLACGSVLAMFPLAAAEPSQRILGIVALGVSGALGSLIECGLRGFWWPRRWPGFADLAAILIIVYVHALAAPQEARRLSVEAVQAESQSLAQLSTIRRPDSAAETTIILRANHPPSLFWTPFLLHANAPKHWVVLSQTFQELKAVRVSPTSLDVVVDDGPLFPLGPSDLLRTIPFRPGDSVAIPGLRATVLRVDGDGRPQAVHYAFDGDLDDPRVAWISEGKAGFSEVGPPPVGFGVRLAP